MRKLNSVELRYPGCIVENTGSTSEGVMTRIGQANAALNRLKRIWKLKNHFIWLKLRLFNSIPVLLYESETWSLNQQQEKRIRVFEKNCLQRILNIHWSDRITNEKVRKFANQPLVTDIIKAWNWRYLGCVLRTQDTQIPKATLH